MRAEFHIYVILVTIHTFVVLFFLFFLYPIIDSIVITTTPSITPTIRIITAKKWKLYIINETQQMPVTLCEQIKKNDHFPCLVQAFQEKSAEVKLVLQF